MSKEYKRIYCCGECIHADLKNRRCELGAIDEGEPQDRFYRDCPLETYTEEEALKQPTPEEIIRKCAEVVAGYFASCLDCPIECRTASCEALITEFLRERVLNDD